MSYRYSAGCPGCKAVLRGTARQGHSEACRWRLETLLRDDERVRGTRDRLDQYIAKTTWGRGEEDEDRWRCPLG